MLRHSADSILTADEFSTIPLVGTPIIKYLVPVPGSKSKRDGNELLPCLQKRTEMPSCWSALFLFDGASGSLDVSSGMVVIGIFIQYVESSTEPVYNRVNKTTVPVSGRCSRGLNRYKPSIITI